MQQEVSRSRTVKVKYPQREGVWWGVWLALPILAVLANWWLWASLVLVPVLVLGLVRTVPGIFRAEESEDKLRTLRLSQMSLEGRIAVANLLVFALVCSIVLSRLIASDVFYSNQPASVGGLLLQEVCVILGAIVVSPLGWLTMIIGPDHTLMVFVPLAVGLSESLWK